MVFLNWSFKFWGVHYWIVPGNVSQPSYRHSSTTGGKERVNVGGEKEHKLTTFSLSTIVQWVKKKGPWIHIFTPTRMIVHYAQHKSNAKHRFSGINQRVQFIHVGWAIDGPLLCHARIGCFSQLGVSSLAQRQLLALVCIGNDAEHTQGRICVGMATFYHTFVNKV